jgi:hypothetical protein
VIAGRREQSAPGGFFISMTNPSGNDRSQTEDSVICNDFSPGATKRQPIWLRILISIVMKEAMPDPATAVLTA